jgi:hypothetical protein
MMGCNVLVAADLLVQENAPQYLVTFFMSILVNIGMWFERFVIIVTSLYRDYLPSSWSTYYTPTIWEVGFYLGTFRLVLYLLFPVCQVLPGYCHCGDQAYPEEER